MIGRLGSRQKGAQWLLRAAFAFALWLRFAIVQGCEFALRKLWSPGILGMHAGQPTAPIGKLQGNRNLARIEVAVGTKNVGSNLSRDFAETGDVSWRTGGITFHLGAVLADQIRQRAHIPVKNPGESGTSRPVRDRLLVEPRSGLVRWVPRAARTR